MIYNLLQRLAVRGGASHRHGQSASGAGFPGTVEPTNQVRALRGGALLIGQRFRKGAGLPGRTMHFDWQVRCRPWGKPTFSTGPGGVPGVAAAPANQSADARTVRSVGEVRGRLSPGWERRLRPG